MQFEMKSKWLSLYKYKRHQSYPYGFYSCFRCMTRNHERFIFLKKINSETVMFRNNAKGKIVGIGKIGKGKSLMIDNVSLD